MSELSENEGDRGSPYLTNPPLTTREKRVLEVLDGAGFSGADEAVAVSISILKGAGQ